MLISSLACFETKIQVLHGLAETQCARQSSRWPSMIGGACATTKVSREYAKLRRNRTLPPGSHTHEFSYGSQLVLTQGYGDAMGAGEAYDKFIMIVDYMLSIRRSMIHYETFCTALKPTLALS